MRIEPPARHTFIDGHYHGITERGAGVRGPMTEDSIAREECPTLVLDFLRAKLGGAMPIEIQAAKSAQQRVLVLLFPSTLQVVDGPDARVWREVLKSGCNRLVVRIWLASSRWWTLNRSDGGLVDMAQSEVAGYRVARQALKATSIRIPKVLYSSSDVDETVAGCHHHPWAVLEYVGVASTLFARHGCTEEWSTSMIKTRHEFGFDEPHPRWGRVPVARCLPYALAVLHQVVVPIHRYHATVSSPEPANQLLGYRVNDHKVRGYRFSDMVGLYERTLAEIDPGNDDKMNQSMARLESGVARLAALQRLIHNLPPVLCHMDCQPQNLLFQQGNNGSLPRVASVLDWEEAAFADPRFELLLLGRKVCANLEQAQEIWREYQKAMPQDDLGDLEPWLLLETVHSLTTLVLQALNLGGRSPWETKPDLWGKIERECSRIGVWMSDLSKFS